MDEPTFDPRPHLITIRSRGQEAQYLPVNKRILWLRTVCPEARVTLDLVHLTPEWAVVKAVVDLPSGAHAEDFGSETKAEFADFLEKAATKALGRALAQLGFGTQFAPELEVENPDGTPHVVDSPVPPRAKLAGRSYGTR